MNNLKYLSELVNSNKSRRWIKSDNLTNMLDLPLFYKIKDTTVATDYRGEVPLVVVKFKIYIAPRGKSNTVRFSGNALDIDCVIDKKINESVEFEQFYFSFKKDILLFMGLESLEKVILKHVLEALDAAVNTGVRTRFEQVFCNYFNYKVKNIRQYAILLKLKLIEASK